MLPENKALRRFPQSQLSQSVFARPERIPSLGVDGLRGAPDVRPTHLERPLHCSLPHIAER